MTNHSPNKNAKEVSDEDQEIFVATFKKCACYIQEMCEELAPKMHVTVGQCITNLIMNMLNELIIRASNSSIEIFTDLQLQNIRNYLQKVYHIKFTCDRRVHTNKGKDF